MDFKTVLGFLLDGFQKENVRYGLIGGFALGSLGVPRATVDLDFLVALEDMQKVDKVMTDSGYECFHKTKNVSQYQSPLKLFGQVDFIHAYRKISTEMIQRAVTKTLFDGSMEIRVLRPEDIIGLKLQSVANDVTRKNQEFADIEALLNHYRAKLNWDLLEEFFTLFKQETQFQQFKEAYGHPE